MSPMPSTRRRFLEQWVLGVLGASSARAADAYQEPPPGMPPAFGTGPAVGPEITPATIAEAEKLAQVQYTAAERAQAAANWRVALASLYERRTGPRRVALDSGLAPASRWSPVLPGSAPPASRGRFAPSDPPATPLPARDEDIA